MCRILRGVLRMYLKKKLSVSSSGKGFTLIEVIVVLVILAVLAAILIPSMIKWIDRSKEKVLDINMREVARYVKAYSLEYERSDWYGAWNDDGDGSLNNEIELEWETIKSGKHGNNMTIENPYSHSSTILDYDRTLASGDGYRPAVFLTANSSYGYDTGTGSTNNIIGAIVVYFKVSDGTAEYIKVYYIKKDGTKSSDSVTVDY